MNFFLKRTSFKASQSFLEILDFYQPDMTGFKGKICILFYFFQTLSFFFQLNTASYQGLGLIFYFSNFTNFIFFFKNNSFSFFVLIMTEIFLFIPMGFFFYLFISQSTSKAKLSKKFWMVILYKFISCYSNLNIWVFIVPFNTIFVNSFLEEGLISRPSLLFMIVCLMGIVFNNLISVIFAYFNSSLGFLDDRTMKIKHKLWIWIAFFIRILISVFSPIIGNFKAFFFTLLHFFFLVHIVNSPYESFFLRNKELSRFYEGALFSFEAINCVLTLGEVFSDENKDFDCFFVVLIVGIFGYKTGVKYFDLFQSNYFKISDSNSLIYFLEELKSIDLFHFHSGKSGLLKYHLRKCDEKRCQYLSQHFFGNEEKETESQIVHKLIKSKLKLELKLWQKSSNKASSLLIKFLSYLKTSSVNQVKCYLETQKILNSIKIQDISLLHDVYIDILRKKSEKALKKLIYLQKSDESSEKSAEDFYKSSKFHDLLERDLKELINMKKNFWDNYQSGINSMKDLIESITAMFRKIENFHSKISLNIHKSKEDSSIRLIKLKYLSFYHSVILNSINIALNYQEEFENFLSHKVHFAGKNLQNLKFLDKKTITLVVSFLKNEGKIKDESKIEKNASFFGYSLLEFKAIKSINTFMPEYYGQMHNDFVNTYFKKTEKGILHESSKKKDVFFALDKEKFVFPIQILLGFNFDYNDDFLLLGSMTKLDHSNCDFWIIDDAGLTIGISKGLFSFFCSYFENLNKTQIKYLALQCMMPELGDFLQNMREKQLKISQNQKGTLLLPNNLKEILEVLKDIEREMDDFDKNTSIYSKSILTSFHNNKTTEPPPVTFSTNANYKSSKLSSYLKNMVVDSKTTKEKIKNCVFQEIMRKASSKFRLLVFFDISMQTYFYNSQSINCFTLKIKKLKPENNSKPTLECSQTNQIHEFARNQIDSKSEVVNSSDFIGLNAIWPEENPAVFKKIFNKTIGENDEEHEKLEEKEPKSPNYPIKIFTPLNLQENLPYTIASESIAMGPDSEFLASNSIENNGDKEAIGVDAVAKSKKSSSFGKKSTSFLILATISSIQSHFPSCIKRLSIIILVELVLIMSYFIAVYTEYQEYVQNYFEPTQLSLINYCSLATSLSYSTSMFTEIEYSSYNITTRKLSPFKLNLWSKIMTENYFWLKKINYKERNQEKGLNYQLIFKTVQSKFIDPKTMKFVIRYYSDLLDFYADLDFLTIKNFNLDLEKDYQILLQRNYPYLLPATSTIYLAVKADFQNSNDGTTTTIKFLLIAFMISMGIMKILELLMMISFHNLIITMMSIFRRVNIQDAISANLLCRDLLHDLNNQTAINLNFSEVVLRRKSITFQAANSKSCSDRDSVVKTKRFNIKKPKFSSNNMKQLPRTKLLFLFSISLISGFVYYFFNYYFWISNNNNITQLIQINLLLIDIYIYSTSIVGFNTMALRERVTYNPEYIKMNDSYQQIYDRETYFYSSLLKRLYLIGNTSANHLSHYSLEAQNSMKKKDFDILVSGDICQLLIKRGVITSDEEQAFCDQAFDGGFKHGIMFAVNQFIMKIKSFSSYIEVYPKNQTINIEKQKKSVYELINSQEYEDFMFYYYYYIQAMLIYYNEINSYYKSLMDEQMSKLYLFLIFTSIIWGIALLIVSIIAKKKLEEYYKYVAMSLSLIPHEKLMNDEQMKFLINNFLKKL